MGKSLILTIGLPRSGKSTWAKEQCYPIVNPDAVRLALHGNRFLTDAEEMVWTIAKYMVKALFLAEHDVVIVDATNNTWKRRSVWYNLAIANGWGAYYKLFGASVEECLRRAEGDEAIISVIKRMWMEAEWPMGASLEVINARDSMPMRVSANPEGEEWIG